AGSINVVTGSVAQLSRDRVMVTVDGATYNSAAGGQDLAGTDEMIARKQQCEQAAVAKVRKLLSYIPDVVVSVSVDLNNPSQASEDALMANAVPAASAGSPKKEIVRSASVVVPRSYFVGIYRRANRKQ